MANDTNMTKGIGTFLYMSPENLNGDTRYTKKVDVFSFAISSAEILTEKVPYSDTNLDHFKIPKYVLDGGVKCIKQSIKHIKLFFLLLLTHTQRPDLPNTGYPPAIINLIQRCWANNPSDRPSKKKQTNKQTLE